jgi:TRAP-type C4-dicarboxylate transport system permease small subunit
MVAINVVDVLLRSTINAPIFGTYEIVELLLAAVAFLVIPLAFIENEHVTVDITDRLLPTRVVRMLKLAGHALAFGFLALLTYAMIWPAIDFVIFKEVTIDLHLPLIWRGSLVLLGVFASTLAAGVGFLGELRPQDAEKREVNQAPLVAADDHCREEVT